jgi:hypothetical protein
MVEQSKLDIGARPAALGVSQPLISRVTDAAGDGGQQVDIGGVGVGGREEGAPAASIKIGASYRTLNADHPRPGLIVKSSLAAA